MSVLSLSPGVVLCFEKDGHIEVEFGSNGECCPSFNETMQKACRFISAKQDCDSHCGICVDVPLFIKAAKKHNTESSIHDQLISLLQTPSYPTASTTTFLGQLVLRSALLPTVSTTAFHISTIQTVILLV
ncbi:MAG: hypothetical protein ACUZ8H_00990 [Candidatus Anammoxibacter sp.]